MKPSNLSELKEFCQLNERICPQPQLWNDLWNILKDKKQTGNQWQPSLPLILAAWWETSILSKRIRFFEHLDWSEKHGQLKEIIDFLLNLKEEQWFHGND